MLVGGENSILGKRWNVQNFINPICDHEFSSFNGEELHKTYSLHKSE